MRGLDCTEGDAQIKRLRPGNETPGLGTHAIAAVLPKTKIEKGSKTRSFQSRYNINLLNCRFFYRNSALHKNCAISLLPLYEVCLRR